MNVTIILPLLWNLKTCVLYFQTRTYESDSAGGGGMPLVNHKQIHDTLERRYPTDNREGGVVMGDILSHVRMVNEEIHQRHVAQDADEHYKSEWRMVALVLDRILLILFFLMTSIMSIVIFVNVPHWENDVTAL